MEWLETEDSRDFPMWESYASCSHWGLFFVRRTVRWRWHGVPIYKHSIINMETT